MTTLGTTVAQSTSTRPDQGVTRARGRAGVGPAEIRRSWAALTGLSAVLVVIGLWRVLVQDPRGLLADHTAYLGADLGRSRFEPVAHLALDIVSVRFLLIATFIAVLVALARGRFGDAVRVAVIVGGANLTTQLLKALIDRPDSVDLSGYASGNSLPSGHTTVAASIAAIALLVAPVPLRPLVALLGAGYTCLTGVATMSLGWHRPADVIAGIAVVAAWTLLVLAVSGRSPARWHPFRGGRLLVTWLLGLAAAVGLLVGTAALAWTLGLAGTHLATDSMELGTTAASLAFAGACAGVLGAASLTTWAILLARR